MLKEHLLLHNVPLSETKYRPRCQKHVEDNKKVYNKNEKLYKIDKIHKALN